MKTLSSPIIAQKDASQAGWTELYDIYLKSAISTPWGSTSILRLTPLPGGVSFFKPAISPETDPNAVATYSHWPLRREVVKGDAKFTNDKLQIAASNVSADWQGMLAAVDWYDTPIIIRKISTTIASPTASDCAILWIGSVDAAKINLRTVNLECSSDLVSLGRTLPAENMHTSCRYQWADDGCTKIRFHADNYKAKTIASGSSTTELIVSGLSDDLGTAAGYGTELIDSLGDAAITSSSDGGGFTGLACTVDSTTDRITVNGAYLFGYQDLAIKFAATTMPGGLTAGVTYYIVSLERLSTYKFRFKVAATQGGSAINITSNGTTVTIDTASSYGDYEVKGARAGLWKFLTDADWGTLSNGFYTIPDAQAGLANAELKPWIQFDLGSAKSPRLWRIHTPPGAKQEQLVRLILFFSSSDASTWTHEMYYELPPVANKIFDVLIPQALSRRYWRICVRSRWGEALDKTMFFHVYAYENSRHYWLGGRVTFESNTTTAALRGVSRRVLASYSERLIVPALPTAPVNGDTIIVERGCRRSFNDCCARKNWENFSGFTDLPYQTVIR